jgi:serine racemase
MHALAAHTQGRLGDLTWPIVRRLVTTAVVVTEAEISRAMRVCYEVLKLAVEPSGAVGVAAALNSGLWRNHPQLASVKRVGIVLCGGNVDLDALFERLPQ